MAALAAQTDHAQAKSSGLGWSTFAGRVKHRFGQDCLGPRGGAKLVRNRFIVCASIMEL